MCCRHILAGTCELLIEHVAIWTGYKSAGVPLDQALLCFARFPSRHLCGLPRMTSGSAICWYRAERAPQTCIRHCSSLSGIGHGKLSTSNVSCSSYSLWLLHATSGMLLLLTVVLKITQPLWQVTWWQMYKFLCVFLPPPISACNMEEILYPCGRTVMVSHLCHAPGEADLFSLGKTSEFSICRCWWTAVQEASPVLLAVCPLPAVIPLSTTAAWFPAAWTCRQVWDLDSLTYPGPLL